MGDVCAPNLVALINHHFPQQIKPDFMLRIFLARVGLLINWNYLHEAHQPTNLVTTILMIIALHMTCHLAQPVLGRLQKLLVDDLHNP